MHIDTHNFISCDHSIQRTREDLQKSLGFSEKTSNSVLCASFERQHVRMISGDFDTNLIRSNREEVASIDKLPNEVLLEVFALLDRESLLNACLVCKSWENLIGASNVTMKKFRLIINPPRLQERFDGSSYWRKHFEFVFIYGDVFDSTVTSLAHFDLTQVRKMRSHGEEVEVQKMMKFLSQMPLVQDIDIEFIISYASAPLAEVVTLPDLRALRIGNAMCNAL
jgi:hypothetical protein